MPRSFRLPLLVGLAVALAASAAPAQRRSTPGEVPIDDVLQIVLLDGELVALDALGGGGPRERLEIGERLLYHDASGRVGAAITDRRILVVGVGSGSWQQTRYRHGERPPEEVLLGDRVAMVLTRKRVLGFVTSIGRLLERSLGPTESVRAARIGNNVGVVVTSRTAIGLSPFVNGFVERSVRLQERIEAIDASANLATVRTSRRLLTFRSPAGSWEETSRRLR